jgi:hypothetical protein
MILILCVITKEQKQKTKNKNYLIAYEDLESRVIGIAFDFAHPIGNVLVRAGTGDVENDDDSMSASIVAACKEAHPLEAGCVPHVQFDSLPINHYGFGFLHFSPRPRE